MKVLAAILILFICNYSYCQNLVPNSSFEKLTNCNALGSGISNLKAPPWNSPDRGSPDLFNTCSINDSTWLVPQNTRGYRYPHSGNGYAGAIFYSHGPFREYLQVKLDSDLVANQTYDVSFFVALSKTRYVACNNIGLYFSKTEIQTDSVLSLHLLPQILEKTIITDTNWRAIGGKYIAQGGERYIIIGNFFNDKNTSLFFPPDPIFGDFSYYFIDDVSIQRGSPLCNANFNIQTNLSSNFIKISGPSCKSRIRIYNALAQLLYQTDFINSTDINVAFLPAGIYFIECQNGSQRMTKKFRKG